MRGTQIRCFRWAGPQQYAGPRGLIPRDHDPTARLAERGERGAYIRIEIILVQSFTSTGGLHGGSLGSDADVWPDEPESFCVVTALSNDRADEGRERVASNSSTNTSMPNPAG